MRLLQPKLAALRERIGDDKQRMSQEMMALYKQEKVNPLGGCLPLIIQMPIFLALYYMLMGCGAIADISDWISGPTHNVELISALLFGAIVTGADL